MPGFTPEEVAAARAQVSNEQPMFSQEEVAAARGLPPVSSDPITAGSVDGITVQQEPGTLQVIGQDSLLADRGLPKDPRTLLQADERATTAGGFVGGEPTGESALFADDPPLGFVPPASQAEAEAARAPTQGITNFQPNPNAVLENAGGVRIGGVRAQEPRGFDRVDAWENEINAAGGGTPSSAGGDSIGGGQVVMGQATQGVRWADEEPARRRGGGPAGSLSGTLNVGGFLTPEQERARDDAMNGLENAFHNEAAWASLSLDQQAQAYGNYINSLKQGTVEYQELVAENIQLRETRQAQLREMSEEVASRTMDPNRFYSSRGAGAAVGASIAVALGALGQALSGNGTNAALDIINDAVDRDLNAQVENQRRAESGVARAHTLYGDLVNLTGDAEQARLMFLNLRGQELAARLEQLKAEGLSNTTGAHVDVLMGQLRLQQEQNDLALAQRMNNWQLQTSFRRGVSASAAEALINNTVSGDNQAAASSGTTVSTTSAPQAGGSTPARTSTPATGSAAQGRSRPGAPVAARERASGSVVPGTNAPDMSTQWSRLPGGGEGRWVRLQGEPMTGANVPPGGETRRGPTVTEDEFTVLMYGGRVDSLGRSPQYSAAGPLVTGVMDGPEGEGRYQWIERRNVNVPRGSQAEVNAIRQNAVASGRVVNEGLESTTAAVRPVGRFVPGTSATDRANAEANRGDYDATSRALMATQGALVTYQAVLDMMDTPANRSSELTAENIGRLNVSRYTTTLNTLAAAGLAPISEIEFATAGNQTGISIPNILAMRAPVIGDIIRNVNRGMIEQNMLQLRESQRALSRHIGYVEHQRQNPRTNTSAVGGRR